jgi:hypothetical protein
MQMRSVTDRSAGVMFTPRDDNIAHMLIEWREMARLTSELRDKDVYPAAIQSDNHDNVPVYIHLWPM